MDQSSTSNTQPSSSSAPPPSIEKHLYPSIQEQHDPNYAIDMEQERRGRLRDVIDRFHATIHQEKQEKAQKVEVGETLEVEGVVEELVKEDIKDEFDFVLEQVEKAEIIEEEEVVEALFALGE